MSSITVLFHFHLFQTTITFNIVGNQTPQNFFTFLLNSTIKVCNILSLHIIERNKKPLAHYSTSCSVIFHARLATLPVFPRQFSCHQPHEAWSFLLWFRTKSKMKVMWKRFHPHSFRCFYPSRNKVNSATAVKIKSRMHKFSFEFVTFPWRASSEKDISIESSGQGRLEQSGSVALLRNDAVLM